MLNSLTLLWKVLSPLFHWCRRLDRGKISHLPEAMHWLSIRDQIKLTFLGPQLRVVEVLSSGETVERETKTHHPYIKYASCSVLCCPSASKCHPGSTSMQISPCPWEHISLLLFSLTLSHVHQCELTSRSPLCGPALDWRSFLKKAGAERV